MNKYGEGAFSSEAEVLTAQAPDQPDPPTITHVTSQVRIAWTDPAVTNHRPITQYQILIIDKNGDYVESRTLCDGSRDTIIASKACVFPMSELKNLPFELA